MSTKNETGRELLERKRAEKAQRDQAAQTADTASAVVVQVGDVVHAVSTGLNISRTASLWGGLPSLNLTRGDVFTVTSEMVAADVDRHGNPGWTALVHDPDRQMRRWGKIHLAPGEAPADMQPWEYGSPDWAEQREIARRAAWAETDPQRRAAALQKVTEVFGAPPTTSTVTATFKGDADADAQQARIAASAATGAPNLGGAR